MPNVTISLDDELIKAGRRYAQEHKTSINAIIRDLLKKTVNSETNGWLEECFALMDRARGDSKGQIWKREDLYDV